jgi:hypothetical protein
MGQCLSISGHLENQVQVLQRQQIRGFVINCNTHFSGKFGTGNGFIDRGNSNQLQPQSARFDFAQHAHHG